MQSGMVGLLPGLDDGAGDTQRVRLTVDGRVGAHMRQQPQREHPFGVVGAGQVALQLPLGAQRCTCPRLEEAEGVTGAGEGDPCARIESPFSCHSASSSRRTVRRSLAALTADTM